MALYLHNWPKYGPCGKNFMHFPLLKTVGLPPKGKVSLMDLPLVLPTLVPLIFHVSLSLFLIRKTLRLVPSKPPLRSSMETSCPPPNAHALEREN